MLKGIAAHYVMRSSARLAQMERERTLVRELFAVLVASEGSALDGVLAAAGSKNPTAIIAPTFISTLCGAIVAVTMSKVLQRFFPKRDEVAE